MNRTSDREARLVALEEKVHEVQQNLEVVSARQDDLAKVMIQIRDAQGFIVGAILKFSRELGAQRERYPLDT